MPFIVVCFYPISPLEKQEHTEKYTLCILKMCIEIYTKTKLRPHVKLQTSVQIFLVV